jgi:hypothetical protein
MPGFPPDDLERRVAWLVFQQSSRHIHYMYTMYITAILQKPSYAVMQMRQKNDHVIVIIDRLFDLSPIPACVTKHRLLKQTIQKIH